MSEAIEAAYSGVYHRAAKKARSMERQRIAAIFALPEARRRFSFAVWICTSTTATVEEARHRLQTDGRPGGAPTEPAPSTLVEGMKARFVGGNIPAAPPSPQPASNASAAPSGLAASMRERIAR